MAGAERVSPWEKLDWRPRELDATVVGVIS
jgi:hypothetical protein